MSERPAVGGASNPYARFRVGRGLALVSPPTYILVDPVNGAFGERLWAIMEGSGGVDELLEELSAAGINSLGDFAMAQLEDDGLRIVVRGQAHAVILTAEAQIMLEAGSMKTWVESLVDDATGFTLSMGMPDEDSLVYRMNIGIAPADQLQWSSGDEFDPVLVSVDLDWVDAFEPTDVGQHRSRIEKVPMSEHRPDTPDAHILPESTSIGDDAGRNQAAADDRADEDYDFDALYGRTVAKTVQDAAVESEPGVEEASQPLSNQVVGSGTSNNAAQEGESSTVPHSASPSDTKAEPGLIDMVPNVLAPVPVDSPSSAVTEVYERSEEQRFGDHDGMTISAARLSKLRQESRSDTTPAVAPVPSGPTAQALMCADGHVNPTHLKRCVHCQRELLGPPQLVPRPSLGRLVFSTGRTVELDRPAIVGRNPRVEGSMHNEMPQLVLIEGDDLLSRSHAMIRLESWHVLIEDLGSRNGTMLVLPGQEPRRLMAGEPVMLESGAVIEFSDETRAVYDGVR